MCSNGDKPVNSAQATGLTRRQLLGRTAAVTAGALTAGLPGPLVRRAAAASELQAVSMAMHVHSSFSEGMASMATHLAQATRNAVDVIWWTDHDWRMAARCYRNVVHFDSLTDEREYGRPWTWTLRRTGSASISTAELSAAASSMADPSAVRSGVSLRVTSAAAAQASVSLVADSHPARINLNGNIAGLSITFEVLPQSVGRNAYLELRVLLSYHPGVGSRPAGQYRLSYRIGGSGAPGSRTATGVNGVVTLAAAIGSWQSLRIDPAADAAAIWPDIDSRDMALNGLTLAACSSAKVPCAGYLDYLRIDRSVLGAAAQATQRDLMTDYQPGYSAVTQYAASEISLYDPHVNGFGGAQVLPDYGTASISPGRSETVTTGLIRDVHAGGGIASYNHPFGSDAASAVLGTPAQQDAERAKVAAGLIRGRALGADLLEVGYPQRGRVDLARHLAAWDACSRNAIFLTANGVTDDHAGTDWRVLANRFITTAWAPSRSEADLIAALLAGRAFASDLVDFTGTLDLMLDRLYPMGSVTVGAAATSRLLTVMLTGAPAGAAVRILQGRVDYAGTAVPNTNAIVIATLPAASLSTGSADVLLDGSNSSYVRVEVLNGTGRVVALSNPIWMLTELPPLGVPVARRV